MDIRVEKLVKKFGDQMVLNEFTYRFREHGTTCIMGQSGCGKTTLLNILLGLLEPDSGSITGIPEHVAAVFQEDRLCENLSGEANIRLVLPRAAAGSVQKAMKAVGLEDAFGRPVRELSGGMRQRVSILRALLSDAELIIMDEPLKGLDEATRERTASYIMECAKGKTLIIVTHDKWDIETFHASAVVEMDFHANSESESK